LGNVRLIWITPDAEEHIAYCARVSSPNQENPEYEKLLAYCIRKHHWSIFEMASACMEITTTRSIAPQIIRHKSFSFQEFSQRYAAVGSDSFEAPDVRRQDLKNRQASHDDLPAELKERFKVQAAAIWKTSFDLYDEMLKAGVAKESARDVLPGMAKTKLYMSGTIRSWITYFMVRCQEDVQKEHRDLAIAARYILAEELPVIAKACSWVVSSTGP
jgi:thymidylate synthase (FAD)